MANLLNFSICIHRQCAYLKATSMIDYLKICLRHNYAKKLLKNPLLDFYASYNNKTWEIRTTNDKGEEIQPCEIAFYKDFRFKVYSSGRVIIDGSLHKYWNQGEHNHNDFDLKNVKLMLFDFLNKFEINPEEAIINRLEIGVNINVGYPIDRILQNLFNHHKKEFIKTHTQTEGNYYQAEHDQYRLKIYNKSLQYQKNYHFDNEILRYEIHYHSGQLRRVFLLKTINDLLNTEFSLFIKDISTQLSQSLFYDFTITGIQSKRLMNYSNRNYWSNLIRDSRPSAYNKHKRILAQYIKENSENVLSQVVEEVRRKGLDLTQGGMSINTLCIGGISTPLLDNKLCPITGLGISMQRGDSKLLSVKGLRFYKTFNYKAYNAIELKYLSSKWDHSKDEKKITEIAHNIRNTYNNQRNRDIKNLVTLQL